MEKICEQWDKLLEVMDNSEMMHIKAQQTSKHKMYLYLWSEKTVGLLMKERNY